MARRGRPRLDGSEGSETDQNIIVQLKKAALLGGQFEVTFVNGEKDSVNPNIASHMVDRYMALSQDGKFHMQSVICQSKEKFDAWFQKVKDKSS